MISPKTHPELYLDVYRAIEFCRTIAPVPLNREIPFHLYWSRNRPFMERCTWPLKALLGTQDLEHCRIILWTEQDLSGNPHLQPLLPLIEVRHYDPVEQARGTPLEGKLSLLSTRDDASWLDGDLFRILTVYNHGGVYVDMDTLFFRDVSAFLGFEFMYVWGIFIDPLRISGAVMNFERRGERIGNLLAALAETTPVPNSFAWGRDMYSQAFDKNPWTMLPSSFFNAGWDIAEDEFVEDHEHFFVKTPKSPNVFWDAFAWHWHGRWDTPIAPGSKLDIVARHVEQQFAARFPK
jgi:hypothetical protein